MTALLKAGFLIAVVFGIGNCHAVDLGTGTILDKKSGEKTLSSLEIDTAPGSVSAMAMLGVGADQTTVVQNPRNLTVAMQAFDSKNSFGISVTPARTSLIPMSLTDYVKPSNVLARIWTNTTFSYAQSKSEIEGLDLERRGLAIESSYFIDGQNDDPIMLYANALQTVSAAVVN